jgi:hypothetical protein
MAAKRRKKEGEKRGDAEGALIGRAEGKEGTGDFGRS